MYSRTQVTLRMYITFLDLLDYLYYQVQVVPRYQPWRDVHSDGVFLEGSKLEITEYLPPPLNLLRDSITARVVGAVYITQ